MPQQKNQQTIQSEKKGQGFQGEREQGLDCDWTGQVSNWRPTCVRMEVTQVSINR